jgi:hypothetical protein
VTGASDLLFLFASLASDSFVWLTRRNRLYAARKHVRCRNASPVPTLRCGGLCFVFLEVLILVALSVKQLWGMPSHTRLG